MNESSDYMGTTRRNPDEILTDDRDRSPMSIVITGNRLPVIAIIGAIVFALTSVAGITIWLSNLDNRSITTLTLAEENKRTTQQILGIVNGLQRNVAVTAALLDNTVAEMARLQAASNHNQREDEHWHRRIRANEVADEMHKERASKGPQK